MNKTKRTARRSPRKLARRAGSIVPFSNMPELSDENFVRLLSEALRAEMDGGTSDAGDAVALFGEYLEGFGKHEVPDEEQNARIVDLIEELESVRIACNGGDRRAREIMRGIHDLLNAALDDGSLEPTELVMTGKIFHDAGLSVPDRLKEAVARALQPESRGGSTAADSLPSPVPELPEEVGKCPFAIHDFFYSLVAVLPAGACGPVFSPLVALRRPEVNEALAGFVIHPDAAVARDATEALRSLAVHAPVESRLIGQLVQMRSWLPEPRRSEIDSAIRVLRPHALPPREQSLPQAIEHYASVCDGSGARSIFVVQRAGSRYRLATVMMKPSGIADAMVIEELSKSYVGQLVRRMKSEMTAIRTDPAGVTRMLRLALADNAASATMPPFRLLEVVECLGLPPLHPDHASPSELAEELLAGLPQEQTDARAVAKAHKGALDTEFVENWFEAGEALEDLLRPLTGFRERVAAVLTTWLPPRREFWARQCALSALAMQADAKRSSWKNLALVARDIASDLPLERMPLMKQIAAASVRAFELQM